MVDMVFLATNWPVEKMLRFLLDMVNMAVAHTGPKVTGGHAGDKRRRWRVRQQRQRGLRHGNEERWVSRRACAQGKAVVEDSELGEA